MTKGRRVVEWAAGLRASRARFAACLLAAAGATLFAGIADAQEYPVRPIQVVVPFSTGSASDVMARLVLDRMAMAMGKRFVWSTTGPAAGGNGVGTAAVARAEPDGYTILMSSSGPLAANKTRFTPAWATTPSATLAPISLFASLPNIIVVSSKLPVTSLPGAGALCTRQSPVCLSARWATAVRSTSPAPISSRSPGSA